MWPNPQFHADFVTFTEEILNEKLHFWYSVDYISIEFLLDGKISFNPF